MKFKLIDPKPMDRNTLKGFCTLKIGPMEIEGFTYHVKNGKSWVGFPSRPYQDRETGETRYSPIVRIPDEGKYRTFQKWATAEARELFKNVEQPAPAETESDDIPF